MYAIDTNLLVYAHNKDEAESGSTAQAYGDRHAVLRRSRLEVVRSSNSTPPSELVREHLGRTCQRPGGGVVGEVVDGETAVDGGPGNHGLREQREPLLAVQGVEHVAGGVGRSRALRVAGRCRSWCRR